MYSAELYAADFDPLTVSTGRYRRSSAAIFGTDVKCAAIIEVDEAIGLGWHRVLCVGDPGLNR
jgi:hypothetical protein